MVEIINSRIIVMKISPIIMLIHLYMMVMILLV